MVNLEWFRTFKAIYETGTLTGAAESLYISQPGREPASQLTGSTCWLQTIRQNFPENDIYRARESAI